MKSRILSLSLFVSSAAGLFALPLFFGSPPPGNAQLIPSVCSPADITLGAYWEMNQESSGITPDSTAYNNAGMLTGGAAITASPVAPTTFINTGSLSLNATGAYVLVSDVTGLPQLALPRSISVWMNQSSTGSLDQATLVALGNGATASQKFILQMNTTGGQTYLFTDGINSANNVTLTGSDIPSLDTWHHIVFTFDGTDWAYYLDGSLRKSGTFAVPIATVTNAVEIGARHDAVTGFFTGYLDDVRIYDRALTANEAASLASGACPGAANDLGIVKSASGSISRGNNAVYSMQVTNLGPDTVTGATITDAIPAGTTFAPAESDPSCTQSGAVVMCSGLTVGSGGTLNVPIAFFVPATYTCGAPLVNTATVSGPETDPNPTNDSSISSETVNCLPGDLGIVKAASGTVNRGSNALYNLQVTNFAASAATGVTITDVIPAGTTFAPDDSDPSCTQSGAVVTCSGLTVGSGATLIVPIAFLVPATYTCGAPLSNTATVSGSATDPNPANNSSTSNQTVNCLSGDIGIVKTGSGVAIAGSNALYTLTVSNFGTSSATGVTVTDPVPAGTTFVPAESDPSCTETGGVVTCSNLTVGSGATLVLPIAFAVPESYACPSPLVNTATVSSPASDPVLSNNSSTSTRTVNCGAPGDLGIVKTGSGTVNRGSNALYNLQVTNFAASAATGVTIRDAVPAGVTFAPAQSDPSCTQSGAAVFCRNLTVGTGATRTVPIAFFVPITYSCSSSLVNTATVSGSTLDPNPANNSSTSTRTVNCLPGDLGITKTGSGGLSAGGNALYSVVVSNFGTSSQSGVTVQDAVPAGVTFASAQSDPACTLSGSVVTCSNLSVGSGATRTLALAFAVPSSYACANPLVNTATVSGATLDPNPSNNSSTSTRTVPCPPAASASSPASGGTGGGGGGGGGGGRRPIAPPTTVIAPPGFGGPTDPPSGRTTFPDVVPGSFYDQAVRDFLERGFLDSSQQRFRPADASTRAELTKLVIEMNGGILHSPPPGAPSFIDVQRGAWYYEYMEDAGVRTWIRGDSNCYGRRPCTARPNDTILRAEAAAVIVRTFNYAPTGAAPRFSDVPTGQWYTQWVQTAADHCILQGDANRSTVRPLERVTRAELVTMLSRAYDNLSYENGCRPQGTRARITSVALTSPTTLNVRFNTGIDETSAADEDRFILSCATQRTIISSRRVDSSVAELTLGSALPSGSRCRVSVMGLEDSSGREFNDTLIFTASAASSSSSRSSSRSSSSSSRSSSSFSSSSSSSMSSSF